MKKLKIPKEKADAVLSVFEEDTVTAVEFNGEPTKMSRIAITVSDDAIFDLQAVGDFDLPAGKRKALKERMNGVQQSDTKNSK